MTTITELNEHFAIPDQLSFKTGPGGLTLIDISNEHSTATIALQGAQVLTWSLHDAVPVIWLSPEAKYVADKSVRGGAPICWPWFGPHATEAGFPGHGYARTSEWKVLKTETLADGATRVLFHLVENSGSRNYWPYTTPLAYEVTIGEHLEMELVTTNDGSSPVIITEALHTYFQVGDIEQVEIVGLEGCEFIDKVNGGSRLTQSGVVHISGEVDRVYLNTQSECIIDDALLKRRIHIKKLGSDSTVVWNPWVEKAAKMGDLGSNGYRHMLCVESANALENAVKIEPGKEHRLYISYGVEK